MHGRVSHRSCNRRLSGIARLTAPPTISACTLYSTCINTNEILVYAAHSRDAESEIVGLIARTMSVDVMRGRFRCRLCVGICLMDEGLMVAEGLLIDDFT